MAYKIKSKKAKEQHEWKVDRYKVYSFKNAPPELKGKIMSNYYGINVDDVDWWQDDFLIDMGVPKSVQEKSFKVKEGNTIFKWDKIYFDIDRGDYLQFNNLHVTDREAFRQTLGIPKSTFDKVDYSFGEKGERDSYLEFSENEELTEKDEKYLEAGKEKFSELIYQAKKRLKENYNYLTSRKSVEETLEANDYRFNEQGKIA